MEKRKSVGEAINLGSGMEHRVIDLANNVNALTGNEVEIKYAERRDWDVKHRLLSSVAKANRLLGYEPQTGFEDGLNSVHAGVIENWWGVGRSAEF